MRIHINKTNLQRGSAHVILLIILVVVVLGLLGYIFWHDLSKQKTTPSSTTASTTTAAKSPQTPAYKTYTEPNYGISFQYPANWSLNVIADPPIKPQDLNVLQVNVLDSSGITVGRLSTSFQGGVIPDPSVTIHLTTGDLSPISLDGSTDPAVYLSEIYSDSQGTIKLIYGIARAQDAPTADGSATVTSNGPPISFALVPEYGVGIHAPYGSVAFYNMSDFDSTQAAQTFLQSSTYAQAKTMIKSLKITPISQ